jgi:hypothetical protein
MLAPYVRAVIDVAEQDASDRQSLFGDLAAMWRLGFQDFSGPCDERVPANLHDRG